MNQNQNQNLNQIQNENENLTPFQKYVIGLKKPEIFKIIFNTIFDPKYIIRTEKHLEELLILIPALCYLYTETNSIYIETKSIEYYDAAMRYYDLASKTIEHMFNSPFKSKAYLRYLINISNEDCAPLRYIIIKNMFIKQLEIQEKYRTKFYNTDIPNQTPFITVLIISHGVDLPYKMPYNENTNMLMYNLSSVPNIVSKSFRDDDLETTLNYIMQILNNNPSRYIDIVNNLSELKETYISNIKNIPVSNEIDFFAKKYADYACRVTKPIKNKALVFTNIINPGIYIVAGVNLNINITEEHDNIINLLIPEDLAYFNELFNKDSEYGNNIFHNPFDEFYEEFGFPNIIFNNKKTILLSSITSYFNSLGINNVGYIDFSCRGENAMCDIVRNKQMVLEEMGSSNKCGQFPVFGGKKRKSRKTKKNNKKNKI